MQLRSGIDSCVAGQRECCLRQCNCAFDYNIVLNKGERYFVKMLKQHYSQEYPVKIEIFSEEIIL